MVNNILFLSLFLILSSCYKDNGCIDADDFGDVEKEVITVSASISENCDINFEGLNKARISAASQTPPTPIKYDDYVKNPTLVNCLKGEMVYSRTTANPNWNCLDTSIYSDSSTIRQCEKQCQDLCKSFKDEPRWVINTPNNSGFGNGVNIRPNSLIYIKFKKGSVDLGSTILMPKKMCTKGSDYPEGYDYDDASSQCLTTNVSSLFKGGLQYNLTLSNFSISGSNILSGPAANVFNNTYRTLVVYEKKLEKNTEIANWTCSRSSYISDPNNVECSSPDSLISNTNIEKRMFESGGFVRYLNDLNINEDTFKKSDTSNYLTYNNESDLTYYIQMKVPSPDCNPMEFDFLKIFDNTVISSNYETGTPLYTIPNTFFIPAVYYPSNQKKTITLYPRSTVVLKVNSNSANKLYNTNSKCTDNIKIKLTKYIDFKVPISGLVQFKILPDLANSSQICKVYGQIVNEDAPKGTMTDSVDLAKIYKYPAATSTTFAQAPGKIVIGLGNYNISSKTSSEVFSGCNFLVQDPSTYSIPTTVENFIQDLNCNNGNGKTASLPLDAGGGGGNLGGEVNKNGSSFINPEFNLSNQINSSFSNKGDSSSNNGGNGNVELYTCPERNLACKINLGSCTVGNECTTSIATSGNIYYQVSGAGGSKSSCGNDGFSGTEITGSFIINFSLPYTLKYKMGIGGVSNRSCSITKTTVTTNISNFESFGKVDYSAQIKYDSNRELSLTEQNPFCQTTNLNIFLPSPQTSSVINPLAISPSCKSGVGGDGHSSSATYNPNSFGGGGSGGGNGLSISGSPIVTNLASTETSNIHIQNTAKSGKSYYNPEYHIEKPNFYNDSVNAVSYVIILKPNPSGGFTELFNSLSTPSATTYIIQYSDINTILHYKICGAKGGDGYYSILPNRTNGGAGSCFEGKFKFSKPTTLNFIFGDNGISATSSSGAINTSSKKLKGGNGGSSNGMATGGGGSGGGATIINFSTNNVKQILAIAGGGAGGYGGSLADAFAKMPVAANNNVSDLLPYLQIKDSDLYDIFMDLKYYSGTSNINPNKTTLIENYISKSTSLPDKTFSISQPLSDKYIISKIAFFSAGYPHIIGDNYIINKNCHDEKYLQLIAKLCLNQTSCNFPSINFNSISCTNLGSSLQLGTASGGGSVGGDGGGGNIIGAGGNSIAGSSGTSYFNPYYHDTQPSSAFQSTEAVAKVVYTFKDSNNQIITPSPPPSFAVNTDFIIPSGTEYIEYELFGGKGANRLTKTGAYGSKISGRIKKLFTPAVSKIYFDLVANGTNGGAGARLSIDDTIIAIAGGGAAAGSNDATPNNVLSDELSNFPSAKKIAVKFEIEKIPTSSSNAYSVEEFTSSSSSATINATAGFVIGDIIFANYGSTPTSSTISSQTVYSYSSDRSQDAEERIKLMCLGKTTCTFNLNAQTLGATSSGSPSLKVIWVKKKLDSTASSSEVLRGGTSASAGNGGGASYISTVRSDEVHNNNPEDFIIIAAGGDGGDNYDTPSSQDTANIENELKNTALGYRAFVFSSSSQRTISANMNYLEYDSSDPLAPDFVKDTGIDVNSNLSSTAGNFFARKGQILRILPESYNSNFNTITGLQKKCTTGMVAKITPRPAVYCVTSSVQENIINPSCIPDFPTPTTTTGTTANTSQISAPQMVSDTSTLGCKNTITCIDSTEQAYTLANKNSASSLKTLALNYSYCTKPECAKATCSYNSVTDTHTCSTAAASCPSNHSLENTTPPNLFYEDATSCLNCRDKQRLYMEQMKKKIIINNKINCYSFEEARTMSANKYLSNSPDFTNSEIKLVKAYEENDEFINFGNLSDIRTISAGSGFQYTLSNPLKFKKDGYLKAIIIPDNKDFKSLNLTNTNSNSISFQTIESSILSNGKNLLIALCKDEPGDPQFDCQPLSSQSIPPSNLISEVINNNPATDFYKFDSDNLVKVRNFTDASLNCTNTNDITNDYLCYNKDQGNENEIKKHRLAFTIRDVDNDVTNNNGSYQIEIKVKNLSKANVGGVVNSILTPILEKLDGKKDDPNTPNVNENVENPGITKAFYQSLISSAYYQRILNMCIIIGLTFYGMGYLMGVSELKHAEIVKIVFKIGFIYLFTSPRFGLVWFDKYFITLFKDATNYLAFAVAATMDNSTEIANSITTGNYSDPKHLFKSVDNVLNLLLTPAVQNKALALLFSSVFGWIYFVILFYTFLTYFYAIANSVLLFMTCQIVVSVLLILGPLFFIFIIFKITKDMFDNWIKALVGFSLQQIFLVLALTFFNNLFISFLKFALGYKICWTALLSINAYVIRSTLFSFWTIAGTNSPTTFADEDPESGFGNSSNMPSLILFLIIMIIVSLMKKFIEFFTNLAISLAGGIKASSVGGDAAAMGKSIFNGAKGIAGKAAGMTVGRAMANVDNFLFASGSIAKQERQAERQKFMNDVKTRVEATSFANDAVSKFKKENALALSSMSASEQKAQIQNVRNNAIKEYAQDNNIKNIDKIMDSKGLNYSGTNLFGAVAQAGKQSLTSGGSLFRSMNERGVNTSMKKDEASEALSKMSKDDQQKFMENVKAGNIHIERGKLENARRIIKNPVGTAKSVGKAIANPFKIAGEAGKKAVSDDIKTQAIKELKEAGKISELKTGKIDKLVPSAMSGWWRSDAEKKLIREKMREISADKELSSPTKDIKVTSNSVIKNLETELKYQNKNSGDSVKSAATKFKDFFADSEKRDKKEIKEQQIKRDEIQVKKTSQEEIAKIQPTKNELVDKLKNVNDSINSNPQYEKYNQATKLKENLNNGTKISQETKEKIAAGNNEDLKTLVKRIDDYQTKDSAIKSKNGTTLLQKTKNLFNLIRNKDKLALANEKSQIDKELGLIGKLELSQNKGLSEKVEERDKLRGSVISVDEKINRLSE